MVSVVVALVDVVAVVDALAVGASGGVVAVAVLAVVVALVTASHNYLSACDTISVHRVQGPCSLSSLSA